MLEILKRHCNVYVAGECPQWVVRTGQKEGGKRDLAARRLLRKRALVRIQCLALSILDGTVETLLAGCFLNALRRVICQADTH
jgi:hypothetical protein